MKALKYFMVGALISIAAPTMAQEAEYTQQLNAVSQALKDKAPGAEKMAKSFISDYKKNAPAILALGSSFLTVRNFAKVKGKVQVSVSVSLKPQDEMCWSVTAQGPQHGSDSMPNGESSGEHRSQDALSTTEFSSILK